MNFNWPNIEQKISLRNRFVRATEAPRNYGINIDFATVLNHFAGEGT